MLLIHLSKLAAFRPFKYKNAHTKRKKLSPTTAIQKIEIHQSIPSFPTAVNIWPDYKRRSKIESRCRSFELGYDWLYY